MKLPKTFQDAYWDNEDEGPVYVLVGQVVRYGRDSCNYIVGTRETTVRVKAATPEALIEAAVQYEIELRKKYDALDDQALFEKGTSKEDSYGSAHDKLRDEPRPPEMEWNGGMFYGYYDTSERDDRPKLGNPAWTSFLAAREQRRAQILADKEAQKHRDEEQRVLTREKNERATFEKLKAKFEGGVDGNRTPGS